MTTERIPRTENTEWGFWGTTASNTGRGIDNTNDAWDACFTWMRHFFPAANDQTIREYLDSKWGRHLADRATDVGIEPAIRGWQGSIAKQLRGWRSHN